MKMPSTTAVIRIFRVLAIAEAFSWAALLVGMFLKWVTRTTELGVEIAGPIHGALFIGYGDHGAEPVAACSAGRSGWRCSPASPPCFPFATVWFERWAGRRGYLSAPARRRTGTAERTAGSQPRTRPPSA